MTAHALSPHDICSRDLSHDLAHSFDKMVLIVPNNFLHTYSEICLDDFWPCWVEVVDLPRSLLTITFHSQKCTTFVSSSAPIRWLVLHTTVYPHSPFPFPRNFLRVSPASTKWWTNQFATLIPRCTFIPGKGEYLKSSAFQPFCGSIQPWVNAYPTLSGTTAVDVSNRPVGAQRLVAMAGPVNISSC